MEPTFYSKNLILFFTRYSKEIIVLLLAICFQLPTQAQFTHPGVTFNTEDLERMKDRRNTEPWKTGYEIMLADSKSSFNYQMRGPAEIVDRNGQNNSEYNDDADAVFFQAIQFYITGDERYAENAMEIIEAWASTHTHLGGNVPALTAADKGVRMLTAAEILRYNYSGWTNRLSRITEDYARGTLLPTLYIPDVTRFANQGAAQIDGVIAIASYLSDQTLFDQAINAFLNEPCAGITNSTALGSNGDSGRDYGHAFGMVNNLASAAEGAIKQGVDLFSLLDNRILAMTEYWNAYGLGVDVPFEPYGTCYDYWETIGSRGRGFNDHNTNKLLEIVRAAYTVRRNIPTPFTTQRINEIPTSINTFFFKKDRDNTRGNVPGLPYATHTGATDNNLTNAKIGTGNRTGSSTRNGNRWTIVGNGDVFGLRDNDECQFAHQRLNNNSTIIAKVNSINSSNSNAKVGLMFRESLNTNARMFSIYAHNGGGLEVTFRNQSVVYTDNVPASQINNRSHKHINFSEGWIRIEVNENRVSGFYSVDKSTWIPIGTAIFNNFNNYHIGLFAGSNGNPDATGTFSDVEVFTDRTTGNPPPPAGASFTPDENRIYYIDSPRHNVRLASTGSSEDPFTTSTNSTGANVEWKFVSDGNGGWHIDRADGGNLSRLRSDATGSADMQSSTFDGRWETFNFTRGTENDSHFITLPRGPDNFTRLQVDSSGNINMVPSTFAGSWESFRITEVGFINRSGSIIHMVKRNATGFAIDGDGGGANFQNIHLYNSNSSNANQQWVEIDRGNGFYSYQKINTNFCIDGGNGGANGQNVYLFECGDNNQNQHWKKINIGDGNFRLEKRNAPEFSLDGGNKGADGQNLYLWESNDRNQNQHWTFDAANKSNDLVSENDFLVYPNPLSDNVLNIQLDASESTKLDIIDITGKLVESKMIPNGAGTMDLSKLNSGVYIAKATNSSMTKIIKIIKEK